MYRLVFLFCSVVVACGAVQITEFVNCGGAEQTAVSIQPPFTENPFFGCTLNGVTAISASEDSGPISMDLVADNSQAPSVNVAATYSIVGDLTIQPLEAMVAFWSVCFRENIEGTGTASASGFFGPGTIGGACDFAHAVPFPLSGTVTFPVNMSGSVNGTGNMAAVQLIVVAQPQFFDAGGNLLPGGFSLSQTATVPEPSTSILAALALIVLRLTRRGAGDSTNT